VRPCVRVCSRVCGAFVAVSVVVLRIGNTNRAVWCMSALTVESVCVLGCGCCVCAFLSYCIHVRVCVWLVSCCALCFFLILSSTLSCLAITGQNQGQGLSPEQMQHFHATQMLSPPFPPNLSEEELQEFLSKPENQPAMKVRVHLSVCLSVCCLLRVFGVCISVCLHM
jgi:hypothetical protein